MAGQPGQAGAGGVGCSELYLARLRLPLIWPSQLVVSSAGAKEPAEPAQATLLWTIHKASVEGAGGMGSASKAEKARVALATETGKW